MNIVIIVVDTLRRDYIGAYGNPRIATPNMDRLAAESLVFDFSFTHSYPTIPHRTDMMTGQYGSPFHPWMPLRHDRVTFIEELAKAGYCTQLIHDTPHLVNGGHNFDWPFHAWTPIRGAEVDRPWLDDSAEWLDNWKRDPLFDCVDDAALRNRLVLTYARANRERRKHKDWNCAKLFLAASSWLKDNASRESFLLWLDCFDPHEPWDAPPDFMLQYDRRPRYDGTIDPRSFLQRDASKLPPEAVQHVAAQYAAKVSWVDWWIGKFLGTLEETGLSDRTAVLLTADHGTNVGERGRFGKGYPVREQEARTPFLVRAPGLDCGRSDVIVQPQDVFATVLGLAGLPVPPGLDSHDVLSPALQGGRAPREFALSGSRADGWRGEAERIAFSIFDRQWCMEVAARPDKCRLTRLGTLDDVAAGHPDVVARMHEAAVSEIERRGADPALVRWLSSHGEAEWPANVPFWDGYPGPPGFHAYFDKIYMGD